MSFCYYVKHKPTGLKYYGCSSKDPSQFWKTYFTSSNLVWFFIKKDGIESFEARVTRIFDFPWQAKEHESRMFNRAKLNTHPEYLNCIGQRHKFGMYNKELYEMKY